METVNVIDEHPDVVQRFEDELERITLELSRGRQSESTELDEDTRRQLEALGYLETK